MFWTRASWLLLTVLRGSSKGPGRLYSSRKNRLCSAVRCAPPQRTAPRRHQPRARTSRAQHTPPANYSHSRSGDVARRSATTASQFASLDRARRTNQTERDAPSPGSSRATHLLVSSSGGSRGTLASTPCDLFFQTRRAHQQPFPHYHHHKDRPRTVPPSARSRQTSRAP
jgi:hypothetical protein